MHIWVYLCANTSVCTYIFVFVYTSICVCLSICMCVFTSVWNLPLSFMNRDNLSICVYIVVYISLCVCTYSYIGVRLCYVSGCAYFCWFIDGVCLRLCRDGVVCLQWSLCFCVALTSERQHDLVERALNWESGGTTRPTIHCMTLSKPLHLCFPSHLLSI